MAATKKNIKVKGKPAGKSLNAAAHPTWIDMIKECIVAHPEDARTGVSRPTIKKFVGSKYKIDVNASTASQLNRAITSGSEKGVFVLPKGPSGKVKLAPKARSDAAKENATPAVKKSVSKTKVPPSKPSAPKKASAVKAPASAKVGSTKSSAVLKSSSTKVPSVKKYSSKKAAQAKGMTSDKKVVPSKKSVSTARTPSSSPKKASTKKVSAAAKKSAIKPKVSKTKNGTLRAKASAPKPKSVTKVAAKPRSTTKKAAAATA